MEQPLIRPAHAHDAAAISRIYVESWNLGFRGLLPERAITDTLLERWARDLAAPPPHRWWVAQIQGTFVGFAGVSPSRDPIDPQLGELNTIAVAPAWWQRGIGRALMQVALDALRGDGYQAAVLWTLAGYLRGQRFYEAMGWRPDGATRDEGRQVLYRYDTASGA